MLAQRVVTAAILIALVLAALFWLPPRGFGALLLAVVVLAAHEWAKLAGLGRPRTLLFVAGAVVLGICLLLGPAGFDDGWPPQVVLIVCGIATLFWFFVAPPWVVMRWQPRSKAVLFAVGWIVLIGVWFALVELQS